MISHLCLETKGFSPDLSLAASYDMCRGKLSAVIAWLMSKCL